MRKLLLFLFALGVFTCKKKEDPPPPDPGPPAPVTYEASVKINGQLFQCNTCRSSYKSGGLHGVNIHFPQSTDRFLFMFDKVPAAGTYQFRKFGTTSFVYEKSNVYYRAVSGELKIISVDTNASGVISKMNCTFNCVTDTTGTTSFTLTEGSTNF